MGIFDIFKRKTDAYPKPKQPFNPTTFMFVVIGALLILHVFNKLLGEVLDVTAPVGPLLIVLLAGAAAFIAVALAKKIISDKPISGKDIFPVIITALLAILAMFFLEDLVPSLFTESVVQLQSIIIP